MTWTQLIDYGENTHPYNFYNSLGSNIMNSDKSILKRLIYHWRISNGALNALILYALYKDNYLNENYLTKIIAHLDRIKSISTYSFREVINSLWIYSDSSDYILDYFNEHYIN